MKLEVFSSSNYIVQEMKYDLRLAFQKEMAISHLLEHINLLIAPNKL